MMLKNVSFTLRGAAGVLFAVVATKTFAVTAQTNTVKGRPPVADQLQVINNSAPGLNPAQGDELEITYLFHDPDGLQESRSESLFLWLADGRKIAGANQRLFTPGKAQNKHFLTAAVLPVEAEPSEPDRPDVPFISQATAAPVLPSRTELFAAFHHAPQTARWGDAYTYCANHRLRLSSESELQEMFVTFTRANTVGEDSRGDLQNTYGIPARNALWTTKAMGESSHSVIAAFTDGQKQIAANGEPQTVLCAKTGTPQALPAIEHLSLPVPREGEVVSVTYLYVGNSTIPDRSRFQWFRADNAAGTSGKTPIPGADEKSYIPVAEDVNRYLVVEATPASYDNVVGTLVSTVSEPVTAAGESGVPATTTIRANGVTFDTESGFPRTGFVGARFQLQMNGNAASNRGYNWSDDKSWLSVNERGIVTFTRRPENGDNTAAITIQPKEGGESYVYTFTVNKWLITSSTPAGFNNDWCGKQGQGYRRPTADESTHNGERSASTGRWWSEWGALYNFNGNWANAAYWVDELGSQNTLAMSNGMVTYARKSSHVVCIANLE